MHGSGHGALRASAVVLAKVLTMGTALISMIIIQLRAGVVVDPVVSIVFVLISLSGIALAVVTLRSIRDVSAPLSSHVVKGAER